MIKLNGHTLAPAEKFEPESFGLNILERQSTATITRSIDEPELQVGDWLLDDEEPGSGIVWRVKIAERNFNGRAYTYTLEHIVNTLRDISMFGEVTPAMMGGGATCTALQAAQYVMARQSIWTLGDFEYNTSTAYSFNGDDLFSAMEKISSTLDDPWWEYDMSSFPFKLHIRHKSSAEACEMRMGRNISTMRMTVDRSRMYTRIYPIGKNNMHITGEYISQNEAIWGRKDRVETDQTQETEQNLYLWALDRLRRHCEPTVTVTIGGLDLSQATGEALDKLVIGTVCRVPLPAFNTTITERITKLAWRNKRKEPESVTVTLCNTRQDVASLMSQLAQEGSSAGGRGGGGRGGAKKAEEDHAWFVDTSDHVAMVAEAIIGRDGEEVDWSRVSEIIVDGSGIHQQVVLAQGSIVTAFGRMDMTEESMTTVFQKTGIDSLSEGDTLIGRITATAESLTAEYQRATEAEGSLSGRITATAESLNVEYQRATEAEGSLSSRITATAESLTAEYQRATEAEGSLSGRITATAESLTAEYQRATEAEGSLSGRITATAESLNVEYQRATEAEGSLSSRITATAESLTFKVSQGDVATQLAVELNNVTISGGGNLVVDGYVLASGLAAEIAKIGTVKVSNLQASGNVTVSGGVTASGLYIGGQSAATSVGNAIASIGTASESGGQISIPTTRLDGSQGTPINFNIAATQKYITDVAAAKATGRNSITPVLTGSATQPAQGRNMGEATGGWYYQAETSYSGEESYTRKYSGYVRVPSYTQVTITPIGSARYFKSDSIAPIGTAHVPVKRTGNLRGDARYFKSDSIAPIGTAHVPVKRTGNLRGSSVSVTPIGTKHKPTLVWGNNIGTAHTPSRKSGTNIGTTRRGTWKYVYKSNGDYDGYYICFSVGKTTMYEAGSSYDYYDVGTSNTLYAAGAGYSYYVVDTNADLYEADSAATYYNGGSAFEYYDVGSASTLYEAGATLTRYELLNSSEGATNTYYNGGSAFEYYDVGAASTLYEAGATLTRYELLNSSEGATNTYYMAGTPGTYYTKDEQEATT